MRLCIYTAIFGDYATLKPPRKQSSQIERICFTDSTTLEGNGWEIRRRRPVFKHPRMDAQWHRANADLVLPEHDITIWIDASFQLGDVEQFAAWCLAELGAAGTALFRHPERQDIYSEASASLSVWKNKYASEPLIEQVEFYRRCGLPDDHGLWAGGIQIRNHRSERVGELNRRWFAECVRWSYQAQLSLPYVLWRMKAPGLVAPLSGNVYSGPNHEWSRGEDR